MSLPEEVFCFGPMRLFTRGKLLLDGDTPVRLGGRAMDLLIALLERAPDVVTKAELETRVWPRAVVETSSLRVQVGALRRALGEGVGHVGFDGRYIANVPGRGYSFVAPVTRRLVLDAPPLEDGFPSAVVVEATPSPTTGAFDPAALDHRFRIPTRLTRSFGRDEALDGVAQLLGEHRLVTLVGTGGIGKTTLAAEMAERWGSAAESGGSGRPVWFVDLSTVTDGACVAALVADALRHRGGATDRPPGHGDGLLILDNCEHLLEDVARLLLRFRESDAPPRVLATSREALQISGERVHRLEPLRAPPAGLALDARAALGWPAVALLVERATAQSADFELSDAEATLAGALCRRLDGLPLAIEMAAARVGVLGLRDLVERLPDRIGLLHGGRHAAPRHQSLRALVDWSHAQLPPGHQAAWEALAVFAGPFTLAAATAVLRESDEVGPEDIGAPREDPTIVQRIIDLADKSLLVPDFNGKQVLYRLLETGRHVAELKLRARVDHRAVRRRHARWVLQALGRAEARWGHERRADWLAAFAPLHDEAQTALRWALESAGPGDADDDENDATLAADLALSSLHLARQLSSLTALRQQLERVGERLDECRDGALDADPGLSLRRLRVAVGLSLCLCLCGIGGAPAREAGRVAREASARLGDGPHEMELAYALHLADFIAGDWRAARTQAQRLVDSAGTLGDEGSLLVGRRLLMQAAQALGEHALARQLAQTVLMTDRRRVRINHWWADPADRQVAARLVLAREAWLAGRDREAETLVEEALTRGLDEPPTVLAQALATAACPIAMWRGDLATARRRAARLLELAERHGLDHARRWARTFEALMEGRPVAVARAEDPMLADLLCTLSPASVDLAAVRRAQSGEVGWCAPEILRVWGERLWRDGAQAEALALLTQARDLARERGTLAWELRACLSLHRLDPGPARRAALDETLARFLPEADGADLREAREQLAALSPAPSSPAPRSSSRGPADAPRKGRGPSPGSARSPAPD